MVDTGAGEASGSFKIGVYPGTFDPITNGHIDIIERATRIVDRLVIGVAVNVGKGPLFTLEERVEMAEESAERISKKRGVEIVVQPFSCLLMDFVRSVNGRMIIRGLRAVSDFEYEFQMASMNNRLEKEIETVFLMASENCTFIASRLIKEIHALGGDVHDFVPPNIVARLDAKQGQP